MPESTLRDMVELTDADLDMVGGGALLIFPADRFVPQANIPPQVVAMFHTGNYPVYSEY